MDNHSPTNSSLIDQQTQQAIVDLNHKLLELQMEIVKKLSAINVAESRETLQQKEHLQHLAREIESALKSMEKVVTIIDQR